MSELKSDSQTTCLLLNFTVNDAGLSSFMVSNLLDDVNFADTALGFAHCTTTLASDLEKGGGSTAALVKACRLTS